ncbi:MAG: hypothetical protein RL115_592 [Bacteroidota bacterium]|jgi:RNAse (barnase) inhibitor barstar
MRKVFVIVIILGGFISCGKNISVPKNILSPQKMEAILWDLMRADQFVSLNILPHDSSLKKGVEHKKWHDKILALHKISEQQFQKSFRYYKSNPSLFQQILDTLSLSKKYEPVYKTDSVKAVQPAFNYDSIKKIIEQKSNQYKYKQSS